MGQIFRFRFAQSDVTSIVHITRVVVMVKRQFTDGIYCAT